METVLFQWPLARICMQAQIIVGEEPAAPQLEYLCAEETLLVRFDFTTHLYIL